MKFQDFMQRKTQLIEASQAPVLDLTECNVVRALGHLWGEHKLVLPEKAHRCHLAEWWLEVQDLPASWKTRALVCSGVRNALQLLTKGWAAEGLKVAMPRDVYPVYLDIAAQAGLEPHTFETYPAMPEKLPTADVLLITNPLKPRAAVLSKEEISTIKLWLQQSTERRVVIDAVYTMNGSFEPGTLALYETGQAVVLHSLSKGWLSPLVMGVALLPETDIARWTPAFRAACPPQEALTQAQALLTQAPQFPSVLSTTLAEGALQLNALLQQRGIETVACDPSLPRYHFLIALPWEQLFRDYRILGLPLSVFGSSRRDMTVLTSLSLLARTAQ